MTIALSWLDKLRLLFASVISDVGRAWVVDRLDGTVVTSHNYIAWGTGAGTAAVTDTTLFTEAAEARTVGTMSQPSTYVSRVVGTITATGAKTITNAGTFTASSVGTLIIKGDFTGVVMASGDSIQFTIDLTVS